ncbi:mitochondrial inner membrane protease subunit 2 isoform X2 [Ursus arctos]|uniref:mitochondrial inner membrane protease subunit 2 isoform X2 n=1 Tax=Ursus arctos TaxID=9644 RepID=UPI002546FC8D|nr:mitochondrial inner membrane protease subunit 2 isoform X2 [Ursus arctos]XP_057160114.1 mitochondrial inner membrane protease subunit 2 isoform X2 [Ursus arctos]
MAQSQGWVRRYAKAFCKGFFVAVPVAVTFLDRVACVARVEGASMQPSLNPGGSQSSDVVLLNHWKVRNFEVQRGDIVSLVTMGHKNRYVKVPRGHIWVEGDHHGHSFDSNSFGPRKMRRLTQARWLQRSASEAPRAALYTWMDVSRITHVQVSLGLLHAHATHILWPPERWQKLESVLPPERLPVQREED